MAGLLRRGPVRNWVEHLLLQGVRMGLGPFPIDVNLRSAGPLARMIARLQPKRVAVAEENLRFAFGAALSEAERRRIAVQSIENLVMTGIELIQSPRLIDRYTWARHATLRRPGPFVELALQRRPAILVTGHFGNFELLGQLMACFLGKFTAIMRAIDNPLINDYILKARSHTGLELIFKKGAMAEAQAVLRRREFLGFMADQNAGSRGVFVDFFGRKASTFRSIALLAMEFDAPVVVGYCRRVGRRFFHEVGVERIIEPAEWRDRPDPLTWITQEYTSAIESFVRRAPEQYLWIHRRWKTRPPQERRD